MKVYDVAQGTPEWSALRAGIPTASEFSRILTPAGKPSKSAEPYLFSLLAERMMGHPLVEFSSGWMERGSCMETEAVTFYEFQRDLETVKVGFMTTDDGRIGASPDRLVGDRGLLEIKCPAPHTHVGYLLGNSVDAAYYPQVQGQLWISGRDWLDILSYHPEMPPALVRVERDADYIEALDAALRAFSNTLEQLASELETRGWLKKIVFESRPLTTADLMREALREMQA